MYKLTQSIYVSASVPYTPYFSIAEYIKTVNLTLQIKKVRKKGGNLAAKKSVNFPTISLENLTSIHWSPTSPHDRHPTQLFAGN